MATQLSSNVVISGLAQALIQSQVLTQKEAENFHLQARNTGIPFAEQLLMARKMTSLELALFVSNRFGLPLFDLEAFNFDRASKDHFDAKF
ncbi:MAG: hypothetical protein LBG61_00925, partial [Burkholderiales bacterium]|nr:hypothetical protein [Burkholderiales bacterium]